VTIPAGPEAVDMLPLLLRATILIAAAWASAWTLRKAGASAAVRHMAWLFAIGGLLALPVFWWLVPALHLPILPAEAATAAATAAPPSVLSADPTTADLPADGGWSLLLLAIYAVGTATLLLRLVVGRRALRRLWDDAAEARDPAWESLLSQLSSATGLSRRVELRIARGPAVPMTWGTLAPRLLLPAEAREWPLDRRRLVLLHELAHVARRDSLSRSLASLACALYWFHPGAWFAARRMRLEQEHAADDHVLMAGGSPQAYALSLLHLAGGAGARPQFEQAAAMAGMYQLERRLVSITSPARRNRPGTVFLSSSALLAGLTTWLVASGVPVSASSTLPGSFRADRTDPGPTVEEAADSRRHEEPFTRPGRMERLPSGTAGSQPRSAGPEPRPTHIEARRPVRSAGTLPSGRQPANPGEQEIRDAQPQPASAQPLRNYGWELPRRGFEARPQSTADSSRPNRLTLPEPLSSPSRERTGSPKWSQNVPRLVRGRPPTGSHPSAQGPLVLSWSLEVGGK
jgi:beta-lactamase regulating signal transducer with metallopeptidase domain